MIELLTAILGPLFFMPLMTGYYAHHHGRSFWRWFLIGCGLPYISLFVVAWTVRRDQRRGREAAGQKPVGAAGVAAAPAPVPAPDHFPTPNQVLSK